MSNENKKSSSKRSYNQKARAQRRDEVHLRITKAAVHLHGTIGPARTTMGEIAKRAGVRRATVYNHFPSDFELIDACSSHWFGENPPPDSAPWAEIADPANRVERALGEMYEYYDRCQEMLENVLRDTPLVSALDEILRLKWWPMMEGIVETLAVGWDSSEPELRASIRVALDFFSWKTLSASGLSNEQAAQLAVAWVASSALAK